jgi:hypothetical protein
MALIEKSISTNATLAQAQAAIQNFESQGTECTKIEIRYDKNIGNLYNSALIDTLTAGAPAPRALLIQKLTDNPPANATKLWDAVMIAAGTTTAVTAYRSNT